MTADSQDQRRASFSPYRKWGIGAQVFLVLCAVLAVVVMLNYISRDYYLRWHVGGQARIPLAPRTVRLLESLTNQVKVTLYYDKDETFYNTVLDLLNEYRNVSSRISVQVVDYKRDPGAAQQLKTKYPFLAAPAAKNLVIFDCEGRGVKPVDGNALTKYILEQLVPGDKEREFRRKPTTFEGERAFTAALLQVTSPKPLKAYFLQGHGEHELDSDSDTGYARFAGVLLENYVQVSAVSLLGTNSVPADCNLLVIAGPTTTFADTELEKIEQYLAQGGRLFALFNYLGLRVGDTGLEKLLANWGVDVTRNVIIDKENSVTGGSDIIVQKFSGNHAVVNPLLDLRLHLILPRSVAKLRSRTVGVDAPQVEELAFTGPNAVIRGAPENEKHAYPLMVAAEKGAIKEVVTERGATRIIVTGDSVFLGNRQIDSGANRDFASFAANWLLDRPQLLEDLGPRPVTEYRLMMTRSQMRAAEWLLLGGMPGTALFIGWLVWLRRRR